MSFRSSLEALILGALRAGPSHGYAIAKTIEKNGAGVLKLGENQLYPALHKLEKQGFVAADWQSQEAKPPRKVYALTETGLAELDRQRGEWKLFASGVDNLLMGEPEVGRG